MLFLILLFLSVVLLYAWWRQNANYWKKRNVIQAHDPLWKFIWGDRSMPEYIRELYDTHDTHVGVMSGVEPTLILKELEDVQAVLASDFQSFYKRGPTFNESDVLADNILFINHLNRWKCIRQKLTPVFTGAKLKNMFYIMDKCSKDFVELLDNDAELRKNPFNALYTYTSASIAASIFGINIRSNQSTMESTFIEMSWKALAPSFAVNMKFFIAGMCPTLYKWLNIKIFGQFEDFFIGTVRKVFDSRRESTEKRHDFIEICLELQKEGIIKDVQTGYEIEANVDFLAAQAFFLFLAGADTSATTLKFFLLQLAGHQDILAKVHEEIDTVFQNNNGQLTYNDIDKLQYLDQTISESMRLYPNIGMLQRRCTKDTVLPASKVKMEKGTIAMISVYGMHRDEKYFPDPDSFKPERFAPENLSDIKSFSYLPFGDGIRNCIGTRYARLQMKTGLAWLLRKYTLAEKKYAPERFEKSIFSLRDTDTQYELIRRDI